MRFLTVDHGAWMTRVGLKAKARMYTIGNPLIALDHARTRYRRGIECSGAINDL